MPWRGKGKKEELEELLSLQTKANGNKTPPRKQEDTYLITPSRTTFTLVSPLKWMHLVLEICSLGQMLGKYPNCSTVAHDPRTHRTGAREGLGGGKSDRRPKGRLVPPTQCIKLR